MEPSTLWQATLGELELQLSKVHFLTWFKNTYISSMNDGRITISVPNTFTKTWLEKRYHTAILKALQHVLNIPVRDISYEVRAVADTKISSAPPSGFGTSSAPMERGRIKDLPTVAETVNKYGLRVNYTFENYIVGKGNELAHAAAQAVADNPGQKYNPLFIYGGVGLGKTHLIQAIGNRLLQKNPHAKVLYITSEQFTNDFVNAMRSGSGKEFKERYRNVDILLIDDVQFISGKEGTKEELFHTFNTLHHAGRQVVFTSDRPPKEIGAEERLKSRFEWGATVDISIPDLETRIAILSHKCGEKQINISTEILHFIASALQSNVRELEGALNKIIANYQLRNTPISLETTKALLSGFANNSGKKSLTPKFLIEAVTNYYDLSIDDIIGKSREQKLAFPRQIIMFLLREELEVSYPSIGKEIGGRDHTTAMHAYNKIKFEIENDERVKRDVEIIKQRLYNSA
ncbi:chromosomal replication initiator protein DnaA [Candidatus Uhrbacteria bacterium]|nr:chromosomal replication initiator protein DnaA [Candidatus Uhrbacteria bacterium]